MPPRRVSIQIDVIDWVIAGECVHVESTWADVVQIDGEVVEC